MLTNTQNFIDEKREEPFATSMLDLCKNGGLSTFEGLTACLLYDRFADLKDFQMLDLDRDDVYKTFLLAANSDRSLLFDASLSDLEYRIHSAVMRTAALARSGKLVFLEENAEKVGLPRQFILETLTADTLEKTVANVWNLADNNHVVFKAALPTLIALYNQKLDRTRLALVFLYRWTSLTEESLCTFVQQVQDPTTFRVVWSLCYSESPETVVSALNKI